MTHRVQTMRAKEDQVRFVTRGDANNVSERWQVSVDGEISRVLYRIPDLGHLLILLRGHGVFALCFALALGLLLALELAAIWRPDDDEADGAR